jgi:LysM repeat protein
MYLRDLYSLRLACISLLVASLALPLYPVRASTLALTAAEVMAAVNELRSSHGLQPYFIDPVITAYAQEHSEYQARIDVSTHLHSDGVTSLAHGYVENVAGGDAGYLDAYTVVYEIWADPVHMKTMVGYSTGSAGVGVASNNSTTYITLNVLPGDSDTLSTLPGGASSTSIGSTPIALVPLRTATMKPNGAVLHEVGYGQSLWSISEAYGVPIDRLRELNGMAPDDSAIWAGQWLLIIPAGLVTPTPPATLTAPATSAYPTASALSALVTHTNSTARPIGTPSQPVVDTPVIIHPRFASRVNIDPLLTGLVGLTVLGVILVLSPLVRKIRRS